MPRTKNSPIAFSDEELHWIRSGDGISPELYFDNSEQAVITFKTNTSVTLVCWRKVASVRTV
jgi:hypothetical protein